MPTLLVRVLKVLAISHAAGAILFAAFIVCISTLPSTYVLKSMQRRVIQGTSIAVYRYWVQDDFMNSKYGLCIGDTNDRASLSTLKQLTAELEGFRSDSLLLIETRVTGPNEPIYSFSRFGAVVLRVKSIRESAYSSNWSGITFSYSFDSLSESSDSLTFHNLVLMQYDAACNGKGINNEGPVELKSRHLLCTTIMNGTVSRRSFSKNLVMSIEERYSGMDFSFTDETYIPEKHLADKELARFPTAIVEWRFIKRDSVRGHFPIDMFFADCRADHHYYDIGSDGRFVETQR